MRSLLITADLHLAYCSNTQCLCENVYWILDLGSSSFKNALGDHATEFSQRFSYIMLLLTVLVLSATNPHQQVDVHGSD